MVIEKISDLVLRDLYRKKKGVPHVAELRKLASIPRPLGVDEGALEMILRQKCSELFTVPFEVESQAEYFHNLGGCQFNVIKVDVLLSNKPMFSDTVFYQQRAKEYSLQVVYWF